MEKRKNILCVFLSDLKSKKGDIDGVYYYSGENADDEGLIEGVHTNEPIAKYLIKTLGKKDETLDKIIMICSEKVQMSLKDLLTEEKKNPKAYIIEGLKKDEEHFANEMKKFDSDCNKDDVSALRYYELAVLEFMKKEYPLLYSKEKALTVNDIRENRTDLFQVLSVSNMPDEKETYRYLSELVRTMDESQANLYIDLNGGFRDAAFILLAVAHIMKQKKINVEGCYHIDFEPECTKSNPMIIKDKRYLFDAFDLISGIDEFFQYGSASKLSCFFEKDKSDEEGNGIEQKYTKNIQKYMNEIAENLSVCCIEGMWNSLDSLRKALKEAKKYYETYKGKGSKRQLFFWLIENIEKEYGELLNEENVKDYIGLIKWCTEKKMLQQALTFYEDTVPNVIVDKGIFYYDSQQVTEKLIKDSTRFEQHLPQHIFWNNTYEVYKRILIEKERNGWIKSNGAKLKGIRNGWKDSKYSEDYFCREPEKFGLLESYLESIEYEKIKPMFQDDQYQERLAEEKVKRILERKEISRNSLKTKFIDSNFVYTKLTEQNKGKIDDLQEKYASIKKIRNGANHGKNEVDSEKIVKILKEALSGLEEVIKLL